MSFSDDARKFAQQEQAKRQRAAEEPAEEADRSVPEAIERRQSECIRELLRWFDDIGMQPHPSLSIGPLSWHTGEYPTLGEDAGEHRFDITWQFEGYEYKSSYTYPGPLSAWVYIRVNREWHEANNREQIGQALLEEWPTKPADMSLEEHVRRAGEEAAEQARLRAAHDRQQREADFRHAHDEARTRTFEAFQEHIEEWAQTLSISAPILEEIKYIPYDYEPKHEARATFVVDETEFKAIFTMREIPDHALSQPYVPAKPTYELTVYLLKDSSKRHPITSLQALGEALKIDDASEQA